MPFTKQIKASQELRAATVRDFSGGWNALDDDLNLDTKYSTRMYNCYRDVNGTVRVRYGTELFTDVTSYFTGPAWIVNMEYYNGAIIAVGSNGEVLRVLGDGSVTRIWDNSLASDLPDNPDGWGETNFVSFAQFNEQLIICNGSDKPLIVAQSFFVDYLQDLATGSNLNVPIAKYVAVNNRYMIMAGDPVNPNRVHISARDTSGTWFGDPPPNDGTFIDVGSVLNNSSIIRGIAGFRDKLIVTYAEGTVIGQLAIYDEDDIHTPNFDDSVEQYGSISHRSIVSYGDDMLMLDLVGVPSLKRTVFTGTLRPERVSDLVDREIRQQLNNLSFGSLEDRTFSVYNQREGQFMFFVPNTDDRMTTTQTTCYVFTYRPSLNTAGWARFDGWNFTCGCRSIQGNIFFGDKDCKIWLYGSGDNPIYADYISPSNTAGTPITFDWELPWADFDRRVDTKQSKYVSVDSRGTGEFTLAMYTDRLRLDNLGADTPTLAMDMTGGDTGGYGIGPQPYGGGRNTAFEYLFAWPSKFKLAKFRISGNVTEPLSFVSISLHYQRGGIHR